MNHTVLFVDDEELILRSLTRRLVDEPFRILTTTSPDEAQKIVARGDVDAIVSDQQMPRMEGTELLGWVRRTHPDVVRFILTGNATLDVAMRAINDGEIHRFFTKPCNAVDLAFSLRQALQQKALVQAAKQLYLQARQQADVLALLEARDPGITQVRRDGTGVISFEQAPDELDSLIAEMENLMDGISP